MSYTLTNPVFKAKVVAYERLAYNPKVWFKEYELFPDKYSLQEWEEHKQGCYNIRNIEIYDILIDLNKYQAPIKLPYRVCKGCGKEINGDRHVVIVEDNYYCDFDCFCNHNIKE